jgi:uncharacterized protein YerC
MSATCSVCSHARRLELEKDILDGEPARALGKRFGVSKSAVSRHRRHHLGKALTVAMDRQQGRLDGRAEVRHGESLLGKISRLEEDARRLQETAEKSGDVRAALLAIRELLDVVKFLRDLTAPTRGENHEMRLLVEHVQVALPVDPSPPLPAREGGGPRRISENEWEL